MARELSKDEIRDLMEAGFDVYEVADCDPALYAWRQAGGANQADWKRVQPFRLTRAQAWSDASAYFAGNLPSIPQPDWNEGI